MSLTRVSAYDAPATGNSPGGWITQKTTFTQPYDLVLDMNYQVVGQAKDAAGRVLPHDPITVTASRGGIGNADLILTVTDTTTPSLSGVYFEGAANTIKTLTVRGTAGDDTIQLLGNLDIRTEIDGRGGNNTIIIGATGGGNLDDLTKYVSINGGVGGTNTLVINDLAATAAHTLTITQGLINPAGLGQIYVSNITNLILNLSNNGNTVNVQATTLGGSLAINTGLGADIVNIGSTNDAQSTLNNISANVKINTLSYAVGTSSTVNLNDQGGAAKQLYVVTQTTVTSTKMAGTISLNGISALNVNSSANSHFLIGGTPPAATTTINGVPAGELFNIGSALDNTSTLDALAGALTIDGTPDNDTLALDDQGSQTVRLFTVTDTTVTATDVPTITYTDIQTLDLSPSDNVLDSLVATSGMVTVLGPALLQDVTVNGGTLATSALTVDDALYQSSGLTLVNDSSVGSTGVLNLDGDSAFNGGTLALQHGQVNSYNPLALSSGASLLALGNDFLNTSLVNNGSVVLGGSLNVAGFSPNPTAGSLTVNGNFAQTSAGSLTVALGGGDAAVAGTDYSQAIVSGSGDNISLNGTLALSFLPTLTADVGTVFDLVNNQTGQAINGTFSGLAEGASLTVNDWHFRLSYLGGASGHDVTLTVVQQPGVWGHVFNDSNHDGLLNPGEPYLDGVTVELLDASNTVVTTALTGNGGYYDFTPSATGTYAVQVLPLAGWLFTAEGQGGNPQTASGVDPVTGQSAPFTWTGTNSQSLNAGLYRSVSLSSSANPSVFGQSVTFVATVASNGSTPTGTVVFEDGGVALDTETLDASGSATFETSALSVGSHGLTAVYSGDANHSSGTSDMLIQEVDAAATTVSLTAAPNSSAYGQDVTLARTRSRCRTKSVRRSGASRSFLALEAAENYFPHSSAQFLRAWCGRRTMLPTSGRIGLVQAPALLAHVSRFRSAAGATKPSRVLRTTVLAV